MRKICAQLISKILTGVQRQNSVLICEDFFFLQRVQSDPKLLKNFVLFSWVKTMLKEHHYGTQRSKWLWRNACKSVLMPNGLILKKIFVAIPSMHIFPEFGLITFMQILYWNFFYHNCKYLAFKSDLITYLMSYKNRTYKMTYKKSIF